MLVAGFLLASCGDDGSGAGDPTSTTGEAERAVRSIDALAEGRPADEPGCAVGVGDGTEVATTAFGLADTDAGVAIDESTVFDLGSVSKQFTGGVVLDLVEERALALDDPVAEWLPEVTGPAGDVELLDLLHHRSGIPDYTSLLVEDGFVFEAEATQADAIASVADAPLDFESGSRFTYSNTNYVLLAEIAQRAADQPFADLVQEGLLEPAGMATAFVSDYRTRAPGVAASYSPAPDFVSMRWRWSQVGDGAVHASVTDMLSWGRFLSSDLEPFVDDADSASGGDLYGAGLFVEEVDGRTVVSHTGSWQGFHTSFAVVPDEDLTVVALCNHADADPVGLADRALELWRSAG